MALFLCPLRVERRGVGRVQPHLFTLLFSAFPCIATLVGGLEEVSTEEEGVEGEDEGEGKGGKANSSNNRP